mmetsp:Transcript_4682/g.6646  ORF Transcript_4682/g.6646 Transcript_4682/m.6646 type:complete len:191 (-) Transcript_4682:179-751(-)
MIIFPGRLVHAGTFHSEYGETVLETLRGFQSFCDDAYHAIDMQQKPQTFKYDDCCFCSKKYCDFCKSVQDRECIKDKSLLYNNTFNNLFGSTANAEYINGLSAGKYVYGNLNDIGWVVLKSCLDITDKNKNASIKQMANSHATKWHEFGGNKNRQQLYESISDDNKFKQDEYKWMATLHDDVFHIAKEYL